MCVQMDIGSVQADCWCVSRSTLVLFRLMCVQTDIIYMSVYFNDDSHQEILRSLVLIECLYKGWYVWRHVTYMKYVLSEESDLQGMNYDLHPKWHHIPYVVHFFWTGPIGHWLKVVHYIGNRYWYTAMMKCRNLNCCLTHMMYEGRNWKLNEWHNNVHFYFPYKHLELRKQTSSLKVVFLLFNINMQTSFWKRNHNAKTSPYSLRSALL